MTESDAKKFLIEMAEHAVSIGPRHGIQMSLPQAFRWISFGLTSAASAANAAPVATSRPEMVNGKPVLSGMADGFAGD